MPGPWMGQGTLCLNRQRPTSADIFRPALTAATSLPVRRVCAHALRGEETAMKLFTTRAPGGAGLMVLCIAAASLAYAGPTRPFKGSLDLEERIGRLTRCPGPQGQPGTGGTLNGAGRASHLGRMQK